MSPFLRLVLAISLLHGCVIPSDCIESFRYCLICYGYIHPRKSEYGSSCRFRLNATQRQRYTVKSPLDCLIRSSRLIGSNGIDQSFHHIVIDHGGKYNFQAGEYCGVLPPGISPRTNRPHTPRSYSIAPVLPEDSVDPSTCFSLGISAPIVTASERDKFRDICICSQFLSNAEPGTPVRLTGPFGKLVLSDNELHGQRNLLLIATGTGIVPFMCYLDTLLTLQKAGKRSGRILIIFGVQSPETYIYRQALEGYMVEFGGPLEVLVAYSRYGDDLDRGYVQDLILKKRGMVRDFCNTDAGGCSIFLCGKKSMEKGVRSALNEILSDSPFRETMMASIKTEVYE